MTGKWAYGAACMWVMALNGCLFMEAPEPGTEPADPCEGVTCSGAGECVDTGDGEYTCECDEGFGGDECGECASGFVREGGGCSPEPVCERIECAGEQFCVDVGDGPECVCDGGLVALDDGACVSACEVPELNTCLEREVCVDEGGVVECVPPANTCEGLRRSGQATEDGEYVLFYERDFEQPWQVYCADMDGEPVEYLTLPATGGARNLFEEHSYNRQTSYERVRIDPNDLRVNAQDERFATTTELTGSGGAPDTNYRGPVFFGTTGSCGWGRDGGDPAGSGVIDLTGTPFVVLTEFELGGTCARGGAQYMERGQVVELEASGTCGFIAPRANAEVAGNECPDDPEFEGRPPNGQGMPGWTVRLGYSSELLAP